MSDEHILNFTELTILPYRKNLSEISESTVVACTLCENVQQLKHTRWVKSYLPGIRVALCMFCSNFRFVTLKDTTSQFVLYYHSNGMMFSTKLKGKPHIEISLEDRSLFEV